MQNFVQDKRPSIESSAIA